MKQFLIFVRKEIYHIWRDRRTLLILTAMPVMQIVLYGFALTNEVKNSRIAILDESRDAASISLIQEIGASRYFNAVRLLGSPSDIGRVFRQGKTRLVVFIGPGFQDDLLHKNRALVQLVADASDPNIANTLTNYATAVINDYQQRVTGNRQLPMRINTQIRMLYNPELKGAYNFVPGVMALVLMLVCAMMTSISIVREKEMGSMEVLLVSPLRPFLIVIAKAIPYLLVSLINIASILVLSVYALEVPIAGSLWLLLAESALFTGTSLSIGLVISNFARTQQTAMLTSMMSLMLPTLMFSGFLFPVENMPVPLQVVSNVVPARWYYIIVKQVMIKGLPFSSVWKETLILAFMTIGLLAISIRNFKIRLT
ncbi:MAG TPA: ABC transporter permease [Puia sp.]|nr:ABC transporter permease [Puia sp.]